VHFVSLLGAGLAQGAVVSLAALGFILIMKATGIANFAQGDLITVGAFLGVWATSKAFPATDGLGLSLGLGFLLTLVIMFFLGILIELVAYRPLSKRSHDVHVVVIATLGVAIVIRTVMSLWQGGQDRTLRSWFNPGERLQNFGPFDDGVLRIRIGFLGMDDSAVISAQRVFIMIVTAIVVVAIMLLFSRTSFGRQVRAIAADRETARLYGVRANNLSMLSFGISSFLAGLAGLMIGSLNNFNLTLGFSYMLLGFAAAVLGGFGSIGGTVLGGILIGLTEQLFGGQMLPLFVEKIGMDPVDALRYASALPYVLMLVVIAVRPQGLFGRASRRL
ncbi:MAG: branched-chain amino acid ABC transporter permease, partial [Ilumatobacteraceae bacterium]